MDYGWQLPDHSVHHRQQLLSNHRDLLRYIWSAHGHGKKGIASPNCCHLRGYYCDHGRYGER